MGEPTVRRISLRAIQPGDRLVRVESKNLRGPRGGRYVFRGLSPRYGTPMTFERHELSRDGQTRTFYFADASPFEIGDKLSCLVVAQIVDDGPATGQEV